MPAHLIRADSLYPGAPYAYAAVAPPGSLIFTAGACPIDGDGVVTAPGDYVRQAEHAMANLVTALAAAGAGLRRCAQDNRLRGVGGQGGPVQRVAGGGGGVR